MILEIMIYGREVLRQKAVPVTLFDEMVRALAQDMIETMTAADGIGLAAQQVGRTEAICVVNIPPEGLQDAAPDSTLPSPRMPLVLVNPQITTTEGPLERCEEGCLSFPDIFTPIARPSRIRLLYQDLDGHLHNLYAGGLLARCIQHETDHLNGILLPDRIPAFKKVALAALFKALKRKTERTMAACSFPREKKEFFPDLQHQS